MYSLSAEFTKLSGCYFYIVGARAGGVASPCSEVRWARARLPPILYANVDCYQIIRDANQANGLLDYQSLDPSFP